MFQLHGNLCRFRELSTSFLIEKGFHEIKRINILFVVVIFSQLTKVSMLFLILLTS